MDKETPQSSFVYSTANNGVTVATLNPNLPGELSVVAIDARSVALVVRIPDSSPNPSGPIENTKAIEATLDCLSARLRELAKILVSQQNRSAHVDTITRLLDPLRPDNFSPRLRRSATLKNARRARNRLRDKSAPFQIHIDSKTKIISLMPK
jgi:hypothetical protein